MYLRIFFKFLLLEHTVIILNLWSRKKKKTYINIKKLFIINIIKYKIYMQFIYKIDIRF